MLSTCIAHAEHMLVGCGAHADGIGEAWVTTHPPACGYHEASLALARGYHDARGPLASPITRETFASISRASLEASRKFLDYFPFTSQEGLIPMTISEFATQHRLKVTKDQCGDPVILGRIGSSNIYEYSDDALGVAFITPADKPPRTNLWHKFKTRCLAAGMTLVQCGGSEGAFSFDPENTAHAKLAITGIRARAKRRISPELSAAKAAQLHAVRHARILARNTRQEQLF